MRGSRAQTPGTWRPWPILPPGQLLAFGLQQALEPQPAYTTVQTMLNILERKGQLQRKLLGRAFVYSAAVTQARATGHAVRDFVDRMFGGSGEDLVISLIKSRHLDPARLAELSKRLQAEEDQA